MNELIKIHQSGEALTVCTLDFAEGLGVKHKNLLETIRNHQEAIEQGFGRVAFQTEPFETAGGVQEMVVAYLTEDQALFIGTLSRNTARVVAFKTTLVKSFSAARKQLEPPVALPVLSPVEQLLAQAQILVDQERRLSHVENKVDQILAIQQEAAQRLLEVPRSANVIPEQSTRSKIQQLVNGYCNAYSVDHATIWRKIYDRLYYLYRVSIRHYKRGEKESLLDVAERTGHLDKIYAIASAELKYDEYSGLQKVA